MRLCFRAISLFAAWFLIIVCGCTSTSFARAATDRIVLWSESEDSFRAAPWIALADSPASGAEVENHLSPGALQVRLVPARGHETSFTRDISGFFAFATPVDNQLLLQLQLRFANQRTPGDTVMITIGNESGPIASAIFNRNTSKDSSKLALTSVPFTTWSRLSLEIPTDAVTSAKEPHPTIVLTIKTSSEILVRSLTITAVPEVDLVLAQTIRLGLSASRIELYPLAGRQHVFRNWNFSWRRVPIQFRGRPAVRADLNRDELITVRAALAGRLIAVLWKWDYGFLEQLPSGERNTLNGWRLIDDEGAAAFGAPASFGSLPLYSLDITAGFHRIDLCEYWGQYVIIGFEPCAVEIPTPERPQVTILTGLTRHNIVDPDSAITITSSIPVGGFDLYRDGVRMQSVTGASGVAPSVPGRYVVQVHLGSGTRTLPLTVGFGRIATRGWPSGFFPIHFYNGWSYAGEFTPNPELLLDLQTIAMFEIGANVVFRNAAHAISDALGLMSVLNMKSTTMPIARGNLEGTLAENRFRDEINALGALPETVLGLYVEDEPPASAVTGMAAMERVMELLDPNVHLLYTVQGYKALAFWDDADSTVRMSRAYPIRKNTRGDQESSIRDELTDFLTACQLQDQSRPLWMIIQAFGDRGRPNLWDPPTPAELRLMVNLALARGVKAITYFCFDSSAAGRENLTALAHWPFVPQDERYAEVDRINEKIYKHQELLSSLVWEGGLSPSRKDVDVQLLSAPDGRQFVWITNWETERTTITTVALSGVPEGTPVTLPPGSSVMIDLLGGERLSF